MPCVFFIFSPKQLSPGSFATVCRKKVFFFRAVVARFRCSSPKPSLHTLYDWYASRNSAPTSLSSRPTTAAPLGSVGLAPLFCWTPPAAVESERTSSSAVWSIMYLSSLGVRSKIVKQVLAKGCL